MSSPAFNPKDQKYYAAETAEDAHYISLGRTDLVPGTYEVKAPRAAVDPKFFSATKAPNGHYYEAMTAEDAFYISRGRTDLVPGCRMR
jgi:hypothetical protein